MSDGPAGATVSKGRAAFGRATWPAIGAVGGLLVLWAYGHWAYAGGAAAGGAADGRGALAAPVLVGWLCALFLVSTVAGVLWAATARVGIFPAPRISLGWAVLADVGGVLLLFVCRGDAGLPLETIGALYVLLGAWLALWTSLAAFLRRWGAGVSAVGAMALSGLCMAGPMAAMPVIRSAPQTGLLRQSSVIAVVTHACPELALLDALRPGVQVDWGTLPLMYRYSGLGQSVPAELPRWWVCAALYGGLALPLGLLARRPRPSPAAPLAGGGSPAPATPSPNPPPPVV